jgi:FkbM family methyltransferase
MLSAYRKSRCHLPSLLFAALSGRELIAVTPPNYRHPIHLRWKTTDVDVYRDLILEGQYALDLGFEPKTIVDAGAHIGLASIYFANRFPDARIIAIEPEASNYRLLSKNVAPYPQISTIHAAIRAQSGSVHIEPLNYQRETYSFRMLAGGEIPAISVPSILTLANFESVDLFKIDIEGSEQDVFSECGWLPRVKAFAIELHDQWMPHSGDSFRAAVAVGFRVSDQGELTVAIREQT